MTETTKKKILTKVSQVNFRKSHETLDQFDKSIKHYIKMFETASLLAPPSPLAQVGLRQVLQTYSETCIFCVLQKKYSPEAIGEDWSQSASEILWWNWWRCDEIHIIVNLGQKYEGNLGC